MTTISSSFPRTTSSSSSSTRASAGSWQGLGAALLAAGSSSSSCWCQTARVGNNNDPTTTQGSSIVFEQPPTVRFIAKESTRIISSSNQQHDKKTPSFSPSPSPTTTTVVSFENAVDWMEFLERTEHRENDEGGAGAYDTMRCDIGVVLHQYDDDDHHNSSNHQTNQQPTRHATRVVVWGQDFHLERLKNSYLSLVRTMKAKQQLQQAAAAASDIVVIPDESDLNQAIQQSKAIIDALLQEAVAVVGLPPVLDPFHDSSGINKKSHDDGTIVLVRVTLLWSYPTRRVTMDDHQHGQNQQGHHPPQTSNNAILVRGHATSSFQPMNVHQPHDPIVVSVVVPATATPPLLAEENATDDSPFFLTLEHQDHNNSNLLPNRFQSSNPHDKVASWCRLRKQLEVPTYKPPEAAEVLMVRPQLVMQVDKNHHQQSRVVLEILEGLSSNVFVIYKDGSLRTATEGVLFGYVRHLVIESAHKVGLTFDPRPIYLHESKQWQECFITSSSRLIWPIAKVMRPVEDGTHSKQDGGSHFVEHWKSEANSNNQLQPPKWQELLKEILKAGGYDVM